MPETSLGPKLSPLGIGTFGIGGKGHRDMPLVEVRPDRLYIDALQCSFDLGLNFAELSLGYGHGNAVRLFSSALAHSRTERTDLFLTHSLYPHDLKDFSAVQQDTDCFNAHFGYADSTLVTQSLIQTFGESTVFAWLHRQLATGHTHMVSLSNASPQWIAAFSVEFDDRFFAHEGHLSFESRALADHGVLKTCQDLNVRNIIWRPLRRGRTSKLHQPLLDNLASRYNLTKDQLILCWLVRLGYYPLVFSTNPDHIAANLRGLDAAIDASDIEAINDLRDPRWDLPVRWERPEIDTDLVALANFEPA
jgi:diketogulonate reductase-like aldo/keto reductase